MASNHLLIILPLYELNFFARLEAHNTAAVVSEGREEGGPPDGPTPSTPRRAHHWGLLLTQHHTQDPTCYCPPGRQPLFHESLLLYVLSL